MVETDGNSLFVEASTSFTLESGAILSTRTTDGDVLTGESTGDSGDVTIDSLGIHINEGAQILTHVVNSGFDAGDITQRRRYLPNRVHVCGISVQ